MLTCSQEKTHKACSHHTKGEMLLLNMHVKPPIASTKLNYESWLQLDDTVNSKLNNSVTLSGKLSCLESTICAAAASLL